jgi:hypothetical protein
MYVLLLSDINLFCLALKVYVCPVAVLGTTFARIAD